MVSYLVTESTRPKISETSNHSVLTTKLQKPLGGVDTLTPGLAWNVDDGFLS